MHVLCTGRFQKDFMLMCNNAMVYNRPETVYYKEAKRLLHLGAKQLSKVGVKWPCGHPSLQMVVMTSKLI